jgi:hypothetical protein
MMLLLARTTCWGSGLLKMKAQGTDGSPKGASRAGVARGSIGAVGAVVCAEAAAATVAADPPAASVPAEAARPWLSRSYPRKGVLDDDGGPVGSADAEDLGEPSVAAASAWSAVSTIAPVAAVPSIDEGDDAVPAVGAVAPASAVAAVAARAARAASDVEEGVVGDEEVLNIECPDDGGVSSEPAGAPGRTGATVLAVLGATEERVLAVFPGRARTPRHPQARPRRPRCS